MAKRKHWKAEPELPFQHLTWESQVVQYPEIGTPGVSMEEYHEWGIYFPCILWRDAQGRVRGILNYYPDGVGSNPTGELPGDFNIFVDPDWRGRRISYRLLDELCRRFEKINFKQQRYTVEGAFMMNGYLRSRGLWL